MFYYKSPPSEEHKTDGKESQKTSKKLLTNERTHGILNELRLRESRKHRTLTNKQQCNPENS